MVVRRAWGALKTIGAVSLLLPTELHGKTIGDDTTHSRYGSQDNQPGTKLEASLWWLAFIAQKALWLLGDKNPYWSYIAVDLTSLSSSQARNAYWWKSTMTGLG